MLNKQFVKSINPTLQAILTKKVEYNKLGTQIVLPIGTEILVDTHRQIALINNQDHITIEIDEYSLKLLN